MAIAREVQDREGEGIWLGNLGDAYWRLGQSERAIECFEHAVAIAREIKNRGTEGYWLGNLGDVYLSLSQWERVREYYEQALALTRETKDRQNETRWLVDWGKSTNDWDERSGRLSTTSAPWPMSGSTKIGGTRRVAWATWGMRTEASANRNEPEPTMSKPWLSPGRIKTGAPTGARSGGNRPRPPLVGNARRSPR